MAPGGRIKGVYTIKAPNDRPSVALLLDWLAA